MIMLDNGLSSPRRDAFPAGLRVLVVDDDPTWLKILEKMLKKCSYEVTTCGLGWEALSLLRERKNGYDIVISDVNMPDMDGFKLLEHVGLEMDLPVIMMSVDGETSRVMKGVQHGACDYLLKPIRMKELRNIWQHVLRKKLNEVRDIESIDTIEVIRMTRNGADHFDDGHSLSGDELTTLKKRKDHGSKHDDGDMSDSSTMKKARVVWTVDLHQKFVDAVDQIGFDKVGPKRILELMNVPWLTRENVASHLQKYRLYLDRLQKENGQKNSFGNLSHQKVEIHPSGGTDGTMSYSDDNVNVHNTDSRRHDDDIKESVPNPTKEPSRALIGSVSHSQASTVDVPGPCKGTQSDIHNTFASVESEVNYSSFGTSLPTQYSWSDVKDIRFEKINKPLIQPETPFNQLPLPGLKHQIQVDLPQVALSISSAPSTEKEEPDALKNQPMYGTQHQIQVDLVQGIVPHSSIPSTTQRELFDALNIQTLYAEKESNHLSSKEIANESSLMQSKNNITNFTSFDPFSPAMLDIKSQGFSLNSFSAFEPGESSIVCASDTPVALQEELKLRWLPNDFCTMGFGLENIEFPWYNDPGSMPDFPINFNDTLRTESEYPAELSVMIGEGLFA